MLVGGVTVQVVRKGIKNLHLGVYPPHGRVRVAAPPKISDDAVRLAVVSKLGWIKRQRAKFAAQPRQTEREMVSGESHYVFGRRYRLKLVNRENGGNVVINGRTLELHTHPDSTTVQRAALLQRWYRQRLREKIAGLLPVWEKKLGVTVKEWGIKRMKTRWGTCNAGAARIWLNLELAKKPLRCLEYLIVHELLHLVERHHNDRFLALLAGHLPDWKARRTLLNSQPLAHDRWLY